MDVDIIPITIISTTDALWRALMLRSAVVCYGYIMHIVRETLALKEANDLETCEKQVFVAGVVGFLLGATYFFFFLCVKSMDTGLWTNTWKF